VEAVYEERGKGYADEEIEEIGIILSVPEHLPGRYVYLFQKLNQILSEKKIECSLLFDFESLSQEKTVVIVCG
jgi:hypothetical protein